MSSVSSSLGDVAAEELGLGGAGGSPNVIVGVGTQEDLATVCLEGLDDLAEGAARRGVEQEPGHVVAVLAVAGNDNSSFSRPCREAASVMRIFTS